MYIGSEYHKRDIETNETTDIYNLTNQLKWNNSRYENQPLILNNTHATVIFYNSINFFATSVFELAKWGIEFGYNEYDEYDRYNFGYIFNLFKWTLFIIIGAALFQIVPVLIALIYLLVVGIKRIYQYFHRKSEQSQINQTKATSENDSK